MPGLFSFCSLRSVSLSVAALAFGLSNVSLAAEAQGLSANSRQFLAAHPALHIPTQGNRVPAGANFSERIQLNGNVPRWATAENQAVTAVAAGGDTRVVVLLQRDPGVQAAFKQFLDDQQNPGSPQYHQWISPEEVGELFGPTTDDVAAVSNWLAAQGLNVASVTPDRMQIEAKGTVATLSNALHTSFAAYQMLDGESRISIASEPIIPTALSSVISGFKGLSETHFHPHSHRKLVAEGKSPNATFNGSHFLFPNDFSTIYDINTVYTGGNTGATIGSAPQRIAIIGRSRISATDISTFAAYGALTPNYTTTVVPNLDPGTTNDGNQDEATLDVDRVIGTARGALAELLIAKSTGTGSTYVDGVDSAIQYEIYTLKDPIMSISFGDCEADNTPANIAGYDTEFQTAAAGGISTFVSSGDEDASGCSTAFKQAPANAFLNINVICASSYVTCVGGTEFNDATGSYWSTTNGNNGATYTTTGYESALGYIPEGAWNEPNGSTGYVVTGTGGGISTYIPKPSWQTALPSTPGSANFRGTPDISFSASGHDGYFACLDYSLSAGHTCAGGYFLVFSGTSAAAPGMAGIAALLNTRLGARQGNINPLMYRLASSNPAAFHDATFASSGVGGTSCDLTTPSTCNNSAPGPSTLQGGLVGYGLLTGYDLATGLGSLDVANFLTAAAATVASTAPSFTITPSSGSLVITSGTTSNNVYPVVLTSVNGFAGNVTLSCSLTTTTAYYQPTCSVGPSSANLTAGGTASAAVTINSTTPVTVTQAHRTVATHLVTGGATLALLVFCFPARRRRSLYTLGALLLMASGLFAISGCGGGGNLPTSTVTHSSAGTYTVTVSGSGIPSGGSTAAVATTTFTLTIN